MPHARRTWFWRLRHVCLLLVLGLGTTVAVAWAAEVWSPMRWVSEDPFVDRPTEWFVDVPLHSPIAPEGAMAESGIGRTATLAWDEEHGWDYVSAEWVQVEVSVGLPLRSLRRVEVVMQPDGPAEDALHLSWVQTGLPLPVWLVDDPAKHRRLPLLPLWPGLVANTLCYGLLWWLGHATKRSVIRKRRFRRGLCPVCRYDIKFDYAPGCPECGWRRV